jgi:diguanylate cyclase (GGDEF)-like protein
MRLLGRKDGILLVGLLLALGIGFQPSIHFFLQVARQVELKYGVELLPALVILTGIFLFHQYDKRQESRAEAMRAANEAVQAQTRARELERLGELGRALAGALTVDALKQVLWRHLPSFVEGREAWVQTWRGDIWEPLLDTVTAGSAERLAMTERLASGVLSAELPEPVDPAGVEREGHACFAMIAGGRPVGVLGVTLRAGPEDAGARRAIGAAAALAAIAVRNVQLFLLANDGSRLDSLTGCCTRSHGLELIDQQLLRSRRTGLPVSALMLDLDGFKSINDRYGHLAGDQLLAGIGQLVRRALRGGDVKCRYGGDEFVVLLPETPVEGAKQAAEWLRHSLETLVVPVAGGGSLSITASIGLATVVEDETSASALIQRADAAMYEAKRSGGNCVRSMPEPARRPALAMCDTALAS